MRLPVLFLMITVAIDAMGISLIVPVMPDLIKQVTGGDLSQAALWGGILAAIFALMQFLCAPLLGHLSDLYGRRPVLLISLAAMAVDYIVMAVTQVLWLLIIVRAIGGITAATHSTANAAMADLSTKEERAQGFGLIGAAFGLGFVLGPVIGGYLGALDTRAPFWAAAALTLANLILGYFAFPETNPDRSGSFSFRRANPFSALLSLSHFTSVGRLLAVLFLYQLAYSVYPAIWPYFTQERFDWGPRLVGTSLAVFGISMALVQAGLIRVIINHTGERGAVLFGLIFVCIAFGLTAIIPLGWLTMLLIPLAALGGVFTPAIQALMSQSVTDARQGELQGVFASANAVAMVISPLIMTWSFFHFTNEDAPVYFPGAPFLLALALAFAALGLFLAPKRQARNVT
jgi:DHA1 family tetracycline resistance protein-like MFS transporter